jgi:hypothetical protein
MKRRFLAMILAAAAPAACGTEELHQDVFVIGETGGPAAWETPARVTVYLFRNDLYDDADGRRSFPHPYRLRFDGLDVMWAVGEDREYPPVYVDNVFRLAPFPAGDHGLQVVPNDPSLPLVGGNVSLVADQEHHLIVFGDPQAPQYRLFRDDPATVPAGVTHVRLLNGLDSGLAIQPARCADPQSPCVALGAPLAVGESFEIDEPTETRGQLAWRLADGDTSVGGPMVVVTTAESRAFKVTVPVHINAPNNQTCPGCAIVQSQ